MKPRTPTGAIGSPVEAPKAADERRQRRTAAGAAARVEGTLKALEGLTPADRLADPKALAEAAADVDALPDAERRPARLRLAALVGQALDATAEARQARLEKLLAAGDYEALSRATKEVLAPYRLVSREVPDALVELERVAGLAAGEEGARERALWAKLQKTTDPVEVVALADELEAKFPWSPALADAAERKQKADAEAPQVDLSVEPAEAKVKLDGKPVQAGPVRLKKGKHRVEAEADGHFVLERDVDVQEAMPLALRLDPKPARPLVRGQKERDVWKPHVTLQTQWTTTGSWTADKENAALVGEGGETWVTATRDLADEAKRLGENPGWQFGYEVVPTPGACEVRLLPAAGERWAVIGVQGDEVYLGLREGEELVELARRKLGPSKAIELDWDGKVLLARAGQALLGSVVLPWAPDGMTLQVAARGGKAEVRSLKLRNLIESGAR